MTDITPQEPEAVEAAAAPEPQQAPEAQLQTVEEREDAYLMQIDGDDDDSDGDEPTAASPAEESTAPEQAQDIDTDGLADAWSVLRRDGFSKDDLAALSDDAVLRLAAHRKKVQSDIDRKFSESKAKDGEADEQSPQEPSEPQQAEAAQGQPVGDNLLQAAKSFADYVGLDEEGAQILAKSYEALIQPFQQQIAAMQQQMAAAQLETARARLADRFPQVADAKGEDWNRVVARMNRMFTSGESYDTVEALMEDAIAFEFRDQIRSEAESAKSNLRNLRKNGAPSRPTGAQAPVSEVSQDEMEDKILELLESDAPDRVQRARMLSGR
jgi:hypothetical protein